MRKLVGFAVVILLFGLYYSVQSENRSSSLLQGVAGPTPAPTVPALDKSPEMQKKRRDIIQRLVNERVFIKIDTPGTMPRISVGPGFYSLDFDTKQTFVNVVYAYHFDGNRADMVRLMDGRTNKSIGSFTRETGLTID